MCVNFPFWWKFILTFCHCKHRGIAQPSPVNMRWIRSFLPQKAGHLQEVERENKDLLHCVTSHIFSSARRQNTSLSGPSGWACMRRQQQCVPVCVCVCVCVCVHGPSWGNSASNNRPNRVDFHRSLQPQTFIRFPPPVDTVMDGSCKSTLHFCTGPHIIVYSIASNLWRELNDRGPVLKTTSVSHRNPETHVEE